MASLDYGREAAIARAQPNNILKGFARSAGDWLLDAEPERLVSIGRLVTAAFAILAVYLDPTRPVSLLYECRAILSLYILFSVLLVILPLRKPLDSSIHLLVHVIDAVILAWLALLTDELTSPFLPCCRSFSSR